MGIQEGLKIYISGALHGSRDILAARQKYEVVARLLVEKGLTPYLPHMQTDPVLARDLSADQVFAHDLRVLLDCNAVVAFLDEPSLGVGAEIVLAIQKQKPTVAVCKRGNSISRFIEGLIFSSSGCTFLRYDDLEDVADGVVAALGRERLC